MPEHTIERKIKQAIVIWGSQLTLDYHSALKAAPEAPVIMIESQDICRRFRYHKQKIAFVLAAMRGYRDELRAAGRTVWYGELPDNTDWFESLEAVCEQHGISELLAMRQNDKPPQRRLEAWCKQHGIGLQTTPNTMFLTPMADFHDWAKEQKSLHLETFYRWQRQRLRILMTEGGKPEGGRWNYDADNRKPLPKDERAPMPAFPRPTQHARDTKRLVEKYFAGNPGQLDELWLPTDRKQARAWLDDFIQNRFAKFGDYEDAMRSGETFLYHSALSALLNLGMLHASEAVDAALKAGPYIPLAAKEGFIRQIIGWREFMFGLYHYKPDDWKDSNYFDHRKKLPAWWWLDAASTDADAHEDGAIPEPPLQDVLARIDRYGYAHHIERLMVCGNYMLLAGYRPGEVYDWFMTMFVDAYEWVMVPNVIGMSQYADGGRDNRQDGSFATKPYISGSNYLQKMGGWWPSAAAAKDSGWTAMYWDFLDRHRDKLEHNFRLRPLYSRRGRKA